MRQLPEGINPREKSILAVAGLMGIGILAGLSWAGTSFLPQVVTSGLGERVIVVMGPLSSQAQDILLLVFVACLQRMTLSLLPIMGTPGNALFRWSKALWALMFTSVALALWHVLLNKSSSAPQMVSKNAVLFVTCVAGGAIALAFCRKAGYRLARQVDHVWEAM